jgi:TonB family protein
MLKIKNIVALLIFTFALCAAKTVSAQDSCKFAADKSLPIVVSAPKPAYPAKAVAAKAEGDVQVDVKIDTTGKVTEATFVSGHETLEKSVIDAALKWKFNETTEDIGTRSARLTFTFYLDADKYEESNIDELKYKYRTKVYFSASIDCFNDCGNTKEQ